ncbi:MAG: ABC transporter ATP-binding protein [Clostridia bacterium]|nr:ABC transporter ATP-binding protein [Clostridia bacterium]
MLKVDYISVTLNNHKILSDLYFELNPGQWLMLIGPNGAGKSTLIRSIAQSVPYSGKICLNGTDLHSMKPAQRAREIGILAQHNTAVYDYTVEEVVELGRYAHTSSFFHTGHADNALTIEQALEMTGLLPYRQANIRTLSGGELQRVFLAQVFAQNPKILILDEPANHLDLKYQQHTFELLKEWLAGPGRAVLSVVHDLSLARQYGTHALLLHDGKQIAYGTPDKVFTPENLNPSYDMDVTGWMYKLLRQWAPHS